MNWGEVQGNAALAFFAIVIVWVFMLRTNYKRTNRIPLVLCAIAAGLMLFAINDKISNPDHAGAFSQWWYHNGGFVVWTLVVIVMPFVVLMQGRHEKRCRHTLKRSHAHARAQR